MSLTDQLLASLLIYGIPLLFGVIVIAATGVPLPVSLLLVAAGSFVEQGEMKLWQVLVTATFAAVLGDQIGYGFARWGGRRLVLRITRRMGGELKIKKAEAVAAQWGGAGIFFSRWLATEAGPWVNITSGIALYPWRRFLFWDVLGEMMWVVLYVMLGYVFSDRVQFIAEILSNLAWVILGLIAALILGWRVVRYFRRGQFV
jgi:membrane protein DedA with SNARE-associated domain